MRGEISFENKTFFQSSLTTLSSNTIELNFALSLWWSKHNRVYVITFTMIVGEAVSVYETLCAPNTSQIMDNILYRILIMKAFNVKGIRCTCYVGDKDTKFSKFELMIAGLCV
jgi:tetrahydromethanopterin S-methyltransferase subunit D